MGRRIVLGALAMVTAGACAFVVAVLVHGGLTEAAVWAGVVGALAGVVSAATAVWAVIPGPSRVPTPPPAREMPNWWVSRPAQLSDVVSALIDEQAATVGITTGLRGAGGFGKTTIAHMACADPRVRQRFEGGVYPLAIGRDVRGPAAIAAKVNDLIMAIEGQNASFTDPHLAGQHLGMLLDTTPRRLLVLDDVWEPEQLAPFIIGGRECARLVTTRVPDLLAGRGVTVKVGEMTPDQARDLLTAGLPRIDPEVIQGLLAVTGRWPLLLRLVNQILAAYAEAAAAPSAVSAQAKALLGQLADAGPAVVDDLLGIREQGLDVGQPDDRARAVRATIEASTGLLDPSDAERFTELGVFAEDEAIPFALIAQLWKATANLDELRAALVCRRLTRLGLVMQPSGAAGVIMLHDVIRDFLRHELGSRLAVVNGVLLDAVAESLSSATSLDGAGGILPRSAWWELGDQDRYLWDHLVEHLIGAGRPDQAEAVASDLQWVAARLERFGPAAPAADLAAAGTAHTTRLQRVVERAAHLLVPSELPGSVVDVLISRVTDDPDWGQQAIALRGTITRPCLISLWPLPDQPGSALRRVLTSNGISPDAVAIAPDGTWLASSDFDSIQIWDAVTGKQQSVLEGHMNSVRAVAIAPDGTWLASGSQDETVRIWDTVTGKQRTALPGHAGEVRAVAIAPSGTWLATGGEDNTVRIWDAVTGQQQAVLSGHTGSVEAVAIAPDGTWLASGSQDETVRIWDTVTGKQRTALAGHAGEVRAVAVGPDGGWLATGGWDGSVRIWDAATGQQQAVLNGHGVPVMAVAIASDGTWLASGEWGVGDIRIWDVVTRHQRAVLDGHAHPVEAVAIAPDGTWLVSASQDGSVRIWDAASSPSLSVANRRTIQLCAVAAAPDGTWLASGGQDRSVRIWDAATGQQRAVLSGHTGSVEAVAIAPDGTWLVSGGEDHTIRIWDAVTGQQRATLDGHTRSVTAVAVGPDGSWLASGSRDGSVRIWDALTGQQRVLLTEHVEPYSVDALAIAPDGTWLASAMSDGSVRIWDVITGQQRVVLDGHTNSVEALAIAPDGSWLASGDWGDGDIYIWDAVTGEQRAVLDGYGAAVQVVAIAPDGALLASGDESGNIRIWDVSKECVLALMRIDSSIRATTWTRPHTLAVVGSRGIYLYRFTTT
jgi:WD40 repeat protein